MNMNSGVRILQSGLLGTGITGLRGEKQKDGNSVFVGSLNTFFKFEEHLALPEEQQKIGKDDKLLPLRLLYNYTPYAEVDKSRYVKINSQNTTFDFSTPYTDTKRGQTYHYDDWFARNYEYVSRSARGDVGDLLDPYLYLSESDRKNLGRYTTLDEKRIHPGDQLIIVEDGLVIGILEVTTDMMTLDYNTISDNIIRKNIFRKISLDNFNHLKSIPAYTDAQFNVSLINKTFVQDYYLFDKFANKESTYNSKQILRNLFYVNESMKRVGNLTTNKEYETTKTFEYGHIHREELDEDVSFSSNTPLIQPNGGALDSIGSANNNYADSVVKAYKTNLINHIDEEKSTYPYYVVKDGSTAYNYPTLKPLTLTEMYVKALNDKSNITKPLIRYVYESNEDTFLIQPLSTQKDIVQPKEKRNNQTTLSFSSVSVKTENTNIST